MTSAQIGGLLGGLGGDLAGLKSFKSRWKQLVWDGTGAAVGGGLASMRGDDVLAGAQYGRMAASLTKQFACFAAGTPLLTPEGSKPIEEFRVGDYVLSRHEDRPDGPVMAKRVEEVFVRRAVIIKLVVAGRVIRTTAEHPFFVPGRGWTPAAELCPGVALVGGDGEVHVVEDLRLIEQLSTVYNLSVADFHTYFVGCEEWGLCVWAHNVYRGRQFSAAEAEQLRKAGRVDSIVDASDQLSGVSREKHYARVRVIDEQGNPVLIRDPSNPHGPLVESAFYESGGAKVLPGKKRITPQQANEVHTEAKMVNDLESHLNPGFTVEVEGMYDPCRQCQGRMASAYETTGADFVYRWTETGADSPSIWRASSGQFYIKPRQISRQRGDGFYNNPSFTV